ncbi:gluconokinase [Hoeflea sp. 108]|uniref:gluconokinase n=1 Tax=Hoeflea sp. 108 TaxID=1116369 RepID=UPI00035ED605|nr:gluconokinase [Hoeflea sp. 108]
MGVAGCGKTSIGEAFARLTGSTYVDGDALHPTCNIAKMSRGEALCDADRWLWLAAVGQVLATRQGVTVVGCSALKRAYRDRIRKEVGAPVTFVYLAGTRELIAARMAARSGHFMPLKLLDSQFAILEIPGPDEHAVMVDVDRPLGEVVAAIVMALKEKMA